MRPSPQSHGVTPADVVINLNRPTTKPYRVGIEHRPPIVETRKRLGDWETDTMIGKNHKGTPVTLVERKSKLTAIGKVTRNTASAVREQIVRLLNLHQRQVHAITTDKARRSRSEV